MKSVPLLSNKAIFKNVVLAALFAATALMTIGTTTAKAQAPSVYRGIRVDMSAIPAGARQTREDIQVCLSLGLPRAFAGRINASAQGAPLLIVRPLSIWLAPMSAGISSDDFGKTESNVGFDTMEGEAIIGNRRVPLTVTASAPSSIVLPVEVARQRAITLCNNFVGWLARKI
jgi:hypothetical protein